MVPMNKFLFLILYFISASSYSDVCGQGMNFTNNVPNMERGQLENGLQYILLQNNKPQKEVKIQLLLKAGRKQEPQGMTGLAHLVTHLQFSSLPEETIQRMQMNTKNFWSDEYAQVNNDQTIFSFNIKQATSSDLNEYFQMLGRLLSEFDVTEELFESNKLIFLNELPRIAKDIAVADFIKASIYGMGDSISTDYLQYLNQVKGLKLSDAEVYFRRNYNTDLMTLVITGDIAEMEDLKGMLTKHLGSIIKTDGSVELEMSPLLQSKLSNDIHYVQMDGDHISLSGFDVVFSPVLTSDPRTLYYKKFLLQQLLVRIVKDRLKPLNQNHNNEILYSSIQYGSIVDERIFLTLSTVTRDNNAAISQVIEVLKKLRYNGVTQDELQSLLGQMESDIQRMTTERLRPSTDQLSRSLLLSINSQIPFKTPEQAFVEFAKFSQEIDKELVNQFLRQSLNFSGSYFIVYEDRPGAKNYLSKGDIVKLLFED